MPEVRCPKDYQGRLSALIRSAEGLEKDGHGVRKLKALKYCLVYSLVSEGAATAMRSLEGELRARAGMVIGALAKFGVLDRSDLQVVLTLVRHPDLPFRAGIWYSSDTMLDTGLVRREELSEAAGAFLELFEGDDFLARLLALAAAPVLVDKGVLRPDVLRENGAVHETAKALIAAPQVGVRKKALDAVVYLTRLRAIDPKALEPVRPLVLYDLDPASEDFYLLDAMLRAKYLDPGDRPHLISYFNHLHDKGRAKFLTLAPVMVDQGLLDLKDVKAMARDHLYDLLLADLDAWEAVHGLVKVGAVEAEEVRRYVRFLLSYLGTKWDCKALKAVIDLLEVGVVRSGDLEEYKRELLSPRRLALPCPDLYQRFDVLVERGVVTRGDAVHVLNLLGWSECCKGEEDEPGLTVTRDGGASIPVSLVVPANMALMWSHVPLLLKRGVIAPEEVRGMAPVLRLLLGRVQQPNPRTRLMSALSELVVMGVMDFPYVTDG